MIAQFCIGGALIFLSVVAKSAMMAMLFGAVDRLLGDGRAHLGSVLGAVLVGAASLWMIAAHGVAIAIWATAFHWIGVFEDFESSLYFTGVAFTTLGFGDLTLPQEWRQLAGLCAANGLLIFGLSTALLVEIMRQLWSADAADAAGRARSKPSPDRSG